MISFFGKADLKQECIDNLKTHIKLDNLKQGETGEGGKGCHVWCLLDKYDLSLFPIKFGWPEWLGELEETLFEGLTTEEAKKFSLDVVQATPVGVDLDSIKNEFLFFVLDSVRDITKDLDIDSSLKKQVLGCIEGSRKALESGNSDLLRAAEGAAARVGRAANAAARNSAWSGSAYYAERAAVWCALAADDAVDADASAAAWSAATATARAAERAAEGVVYTKYEEKLIQLLKECK